MIIKQVWSQVRAEMPLVGRCGDLVQRWLTRLLAPVQRFALKSMIKSFHAGSDDIEVRQILEFLDQHSVQMIPYEFVAKYRANDITPVMDESGYPYVIAAGHKVYFPKEMTAADVRAAVHAALIEQDTLSPHCYNNGYFTFHDEGAGVFIGASDGIYCLTILEHFRSVYLFEVDQKWFVPLTRTFAPWGDKVKIIQKFVSDRDKDDELTLDTFSLTIDDEITYIQADVEGAEKKLLIGAGELLARGKNLKISICSYHRYTDFSELGSILKSKGFSISHSQGYLIMWMQVPLRKPYLRRGVIYAGRSAELRAEG